MLIRVYRIVYVHSILLYDLLLQTMKYGATDVERIRKKDFTCILGLYTFPVIQNQTNITLSIC